jgi:hypothetical protein
MPREARTGPPGAREDVCPSCGLIFKIGEWIYCPHGKGGLGLEDPLMPYNDWQLDPYDYEGPEITTRAQRRKIMAKHGLDYVDPAKLTQPAGKRLYFDMKKG